MPANVPAAAEIPPDWISRSGPCSGLAGLAGRIRLRAGGADVGVLKVAGGSAEIGRNGEAEATLHAESVPTLVGLLGGEVQPIVARLQNRVQVDGDLGVVLRVFLGLQAGSPWSGLVSKS